MRVLVAHNSYQQAGGEDQCVAAEVAMLEAYGHDVVRYTQSNHAVESMGSLSLGARTVWNPSAVRDLARLIRKHRPQVVHFHNTLPLISPAGYYAARAAGVPIVQTLHNFRISCVNALLFREGQICEDCLGGYMPWRGVLRKCYRQNRAASAAVAASMAVHRTLGTWRRNIDVYVALSEFSRSRFIKAGLPADKIVVKPNFVYPDPGPGAGSGRYAIFVGRLSEEKGLPTLLSAWRTLRTLIPLKVVGDGPLAPMVEAAARAGDVEWLREVPHDDVYRLLGEATVLVVPSQCYENFPRVIVEAFAKRTPAIVSKLGAMAEIVQDGSTGVHFRAGDPLDLQHKVRALVTNCDTLDQVRRSARSAFEHHFTADANHKMLMSVYTRAAANAPKTTSKLRGIVKTDGARSV